MLGKYYTASPLSGAADIFGDALNAYAQIEKAKIQADAAEAQAKAAAAAQRAAYASQGGGISPSTKLGLMIGLPAVGLLVLALVLKGRK